MSKTNKINNIKSSLLLGNYNEENNIKKSNYSIILKRVKSDLIDNEYNNIKYYKEYFKRMNKNNYKPISKINIEITNDINFKIPNYLLMLKNYNIKDTINLIHKHIYDKIVNKYSTMLEREDVISAISNKFYIMYKNVILEKVTNIKMLDKLQYDKYPSLYVYFYK